MWCSGKMKFFFTVALASIFCSLFACQIRMPKKERKKPAAAKAAVKKHPEIDPRKVSEDEVVVAGTIEVHDPQVKEIWISVSGTRNKVKFGGYGVKPRGKKKFKFSVEGRHFKDKSAKVPQNITLVVYNTPATELGQMNHTSTSYLTRGSKGHEIVLGSKK